MNMKKMFSSSFQGYTSMFKSRNTMLDECFYDVESMTREERQRLTSETNPEGSILIISPKSLNKKYVCYPSVAKFLKSKHKDVSKFVIAGVGSSDLGGASLARNVADFFGEDVGAIVAGYGVADLLSEAVGGWFSLGSANRLASYIEEAEDVLAAENEVALDHDVHPYVAGHPDSRTFLRLLVSKDARIDLILGHSKGCLSLANGLNGFVSSSSGEMIKKRAGEIRIVTTGAVTELPDVFSDNTFQYLGGIDWFGGMNSRFNLDYQLVPGAWHHTNRKLPFAMSIPDVLTKIGKGKLNAAT